MKNKKGFTLIELLAVIVILAIIALIAVPIVINIINKANKSAFKDTAYGILSAGELYFAEKQLDLDGVSGTVEFTFPNDIDDLGIKGNLPKQGSMEITKEGDIALAISNGRYCIIKDFQESDITIYESVEQCFLPGTRVVSGKSQLTLSNSGGVNLIDYKIYGNSVQTYSNKNLLLATDFYQNQGDYSQLVEDGRNCVRFTDSKGFKYKGLTFKEKTQYTISFWYKTEVRIGSGDASSRFFVFYYTDGTKDLVTQKSTNGEWAYKSFTSAVGKTVSYIGMDSVSFYNWLYVDINTFQLEKGTEATEYEPHIKTPTPEAPIEVESVGDKTKNLFDINNIIDNKKLSLGNEYNDTKRYISNYIDCSNIDSVSINLGASFAWYDENKEIVSYENKSATVFRNYVKPAGARYLRVDFDKSVVSSDKVMIVAGNYTSDTIPDYEPYGYKISVKVSNGTEEVTTNIYLNEPLRKAGDYADYIDFENKKVVRKIYKRLLSDMPFQIQNVSASGGYRVGFFSTTGVDEKTIMTRGVAQPGFCNVLPANNGEWNYLKSENIRFGQDNRMLYVYALNTYESKETLLNYLGNGDMNMPYVTYPLATPIEETIELPNMPTFKGTTIIEVDTKIQPSKIEVRY